MELKINILAEGRTLTVQDNTKYLHEEAGIDPTTYKRSEVIPLILLERHTSDKNIITHTFGNSIDITKDGWYTLHYIIIPNKKWYDNTEHKSLYGDLILYTDGKDVYEGESKINLTDLLDLKYHKNIKTNIICTEEQYVNILNLYNCYINLCQQLLQDRGFSKCRNKNTLDEELIYNRDLVWMAINVIEYLFERDPNNLEYVQSIIEMIHSCNGICQEDGDLKQTINYGCGCSKR